VVVPRCVGGLEQHLAGTRANASEVGERDGRSRLVVRVEVDGEAGLRACIMFP
jgi:hypothetical protein